MKDPDKYLAASQLALDAAREEFANHRATDATADAMCDFMVVWIRELGFEVVVRYEWMYPAAHRILERLGFVPVVGAVRELHFVITPRVVDIAFVHVVSL